VAANPIIAIVGAGRLGTALAKELSRAGYSVGEIISRNNAVSLKKSRALAKSIKAVSVSLKDATSDADLYWLCVPDRQIESVGHELAASRRHCNGKVIFHSSGALASDELRELRKKGAAVASVHPLMTFVSRSVPSFKGLPWAVEGDKAAVRLARKIIKASGGETFALRKKDKAAYHAWATFCSPLLIAALITAEQVGRIAGFPPEIARRKMLPIVMQTMANYAALGPERAFSGAIVRGDVETLSKHLKALRKIPEAKAVYLALAKSATRHLPVRNRAKLGRALQ
jgi:predicted short-subunit dehydrogenase-like oxidoreductase (DUF2520 family)